MARPIRRTIAVGVIIMNLTQPFLVNPAKIVAELHFISLIVSALVLGIDFSNKNPAKTHWLNWFYFTFLGVNITFMTHFGLPERRVMAAFLVSAGVTSVMAFSRSYKASVISGLLVIAFYLGINAYLGTWGKEIGFVSLIFFQTIFLGIFIATLAERSRRREFLLRSQVEEILHSALPKSVVKRKLANPAGLMVDHVDSATVLFLDLVGFTTLAERKSPEELVKLLDSIYSRFDALIKKSPAEKIKTVGDSYMVVCGIPDQCENHVAVMAGLALDLREAVHRFSYVSGEDISVRIGLHTGPVAAGIIGRERWQYDIWGDTVNIASKLEASGVVNAIHVTEAIYSKLSKSFTFYDRGFTKIKNKEPLRTYILDGVKAAEYSLETTEDQELQNDAQMAMPISFDRAG